MDESLYDEFGNYIGPEVGDSDLDDENDLLVADDLDNISENQDPLDQQEFSSIPSNEENRIILHEDKKYYPDANEVYPGVKTVVLDEDAQKLSDPIIQPVHVKTFATESKDIPSLKYSKEFLQSLMQTPFLIRHLAVLGHLHHGKTALCDTMVQAAHSEEWDINKQMRYSDTRVDEQERELSIKATCLSMVLQDLREKSFLLNILDCPGHVNFSDESTVALRGVDGALIVVDAVEGVMMNTERQIIQALRAQVQLCLVINKMDRLILELKLPPQDAYYKLIHTIEEVNRIIRENTSPEKTPIRLSPELGNVAFASSLHGWSFTLPSFSHLYAQRLSSTSSTQSSLKNPPFDAEKFQKRLWGDWYVQLSSAKLVSGKKFEGKSQLHENEDFVRSFLHFILLPLYKLYSLIVSENPEALQGVLKSLGVRLTPRESHLDPQPLLKLCLSRYFASTSPSGLVDMCVRHFPPPCLPQSPSTSSGAWVKVPLNYLGAPPSHSSLTQALWRGESNPEIAPFHAEAIKFIPTADGSQFWVLIRVYSGTISTGMSIRVLGEAFAGMQEEEDIHVVTVTSLALSLGRSYLPVSSAGAGNLVCCQGIDRVIRKSATLIEASYQRFHGRYLEEDVSVFRPFQFDNVPVMQVSLEPWNPTDFPRLLEGLRRVEKSYPLARLRVEESGEHLLQASGELSLDCMLHDLRHLFGGHRISSTDDKTLLSSSTLEIKVSDPFTPFRETILESSKRVVSTLTSNGKNRLSFVAEPLEQGLAESLDRSGLTLADFQDDSALAPKDLSTLNHSDQNLAGSVPKKNFQEFFRKGYGWDLLATRSIWAFGPEKGGNSGKSSSVSGGLGHFYRSGGGHGWKGPVSILVEGSNQSNGNTSGNNRFVGHPGERGSGLGDHCSNFLLNDTLPSEVDKSLLNSVQDSLVQGFQWACREGPLCEEPLRNIKFKLLNVDLAQEALYRGGGQLIPTTRRSIYSSMLLAEPRLMEPIYSVEIQCSADIVSSLYPVLARRRGHPVIDRPKPGAPFYTVKAFLPVIDSFGFETDLRSFAQGQAFCQSVFDHWAVVSGDPLDTSVVLHPLEPAPPLALARDFMIKTRRRKGLPEDISISKYFDDPSQLNILQGKLMM